MKTSFIAALALAGFAAAAPLSSRQEQTARIELEIESDTFVQDEIPLNVRFSTAENPRLDQGISASVVSPDGVQCQAFDANGEPLGAPFDDTAVQFSDTPVAISAYFCRGGRINGDAGDDNNVNSTVQAQGQARIQIEFTSDGFMQDEIPIGVKVSTEDHPALDTGLNVSLVSATGVANPNAVTCQAYNRGRRLGEPFGIGKTIVFTTNSNAPVHIDAYLCSV